MGQDEDEAISLAISTVAQTDPLIKLLQQVKLGRSQATSPAVRAITESWLETYRKVIESSPLSRRFLLRLDPRPRIDVLIEAGMLDPSNEVGLSLRTSFERRLAQAEPE
jgi:hypothetical protein